MKWRRESASSCARAGLGMAVDRHDFVLRAAQRCEQVTGGLTRGIERWNLALAAMDRLKGMHW